VTVNGGATLIRQSQPVSMYFQRSFFFLPITKPLVLLRRWKNALIQDRGYLRSLQQREHVITRTRSYCLALPVACFPTFPIVREQAPGTTIVRDAHLSNRSPIPRTASTISVLITQLFNQFLLFPNHRDLQGTTHRKVIQAHLSANILEKNSPLCMRQEVANGS
jgi:hypothetical protein